MKKDFKMHILCSAVLTILAGAEKAFEIGVATEVNDHSKFNTPLKHCCGDMLANIAGITAGLVIKKIITSV